MFWYHAYVLAFGCWLSEFAEDLPRGDYGHAMLTLVMAATMACYAASECRKRHA